MTMSILKLTDNLFLISIKITDIIIIKFTIKWINLELIINNI